MAGTNGVLEQAYAAFNKRDINGALALMTQDVSWPRASAKKRFVRIGLDNGVSSILTSNRSR